MQVEWCVYDGERRIYNVIEVDARGFSCPVPVVKTKKAMETNPGKELTVLVETAVSKENVSRLAQNQGYSVNVESVDDEYKLTLTPPQKQE
jgi:tRNA 2-thiouridine synthesizing protein A